MNDVVIQFPIIARPLPVEARLHAIQHVAIGPQPQEATALSDAATAEARRIEMLAIDGTRHIAAHSMPDRARDTMVSILRDVANRLERREI